MPKQAAAIERISLPAWISEPENAQVPGVPGRASASRPVLSFQGTFGAIPSARHPLLFYAVFAGGFSWHGGFIPAASFSLSFTLLLLIARWNFFLQDGCKPWARPDCARSRRTAPATELYRFLALREWGLVVPAIFPRLGLYSSSRSLSPSSAVRERRCPRVLARPSVSLPGRDFPLWHCSLLWPRWSSAARFLIYGKPTESGMLWTLRGSVSCLSVLRRRPRGHGVHGDGCD